MLQIKNTNINEDVISSVAEMWHLEEFLDVRLICMDGVVRGSKMVLAAHSPLLEAILDHPDKDHILLMEYTRNTVEFLVSVLHGHCPSGNEWKKIRIEEIVSLDSTLALHTSFHTLLQSYLENESFVTNNYNEEFVQFATKNEEELKKMEISSKLSLQVADELYSKDDNESVASDLTIALDAFENELEDSDFNAEDEPTHQESASDDKVTDCINTDVETKDAQTEGSRRTLRKFDSDDEETEKERFVSEKEASLLCSPYITKSGTNDSGKSKYTCKKCHYSHADEKPVINHVCCHLNIFTIKCNICGQLERQPPNMEKHLNKHHGLTREEDKKDDFTLITPNQCTLGIMPQRFIPYLCEFCAKPLKGKKMADEHNEVCGRGLKNTWFSIVGRGLFQCNTCKEVCKGKLLLKSHLAYTHNQTLPFYCDQCGDSFFTESSLNIHFDSYHGSGNKKKGKVSKDDDEDSNSVNSMIGNYHLRKHYTYIPMKQAVPIIETYFQGEKEFMCKICQAIEMTRKQIRDHLLDNHLKLFLFKCELCSKKVKKEEDYHVHMLKEHGIDNEHPIEIMNNVSIDPGLYLVQQDQVLIDGKSGSEGVNNVDSGAVNAESIGDHDQIITILKKEPNDAEESDISTARIKIMQSTEPIELQVTESMEQPKTELVVIQDIISSNDSSKKNKEQEDTLTNQNVEIDISNAIIAQRDLLKNKPEDEQLNNPSWLKENSSNVYKPITNKVPKSLITPNKEKNKRVDKIYVDDADEPLLGKGSKKLDKLISGKVFEEQEAEELVQKHVSKTVLDRQYKCGLCDFSTPKLEFARIHIYDHFGVYFYQCDKCKDLFRKRTHYDRHLLSHKVREEKGKLLDQDKVGNYHIAKSMTYIPIKKARPIIDTYFSKDEDSGTLACKLCQFSAQENKDMRHHLLRYHLKLNVFKCKICAEQFQVEYDLKKHVKVDHETNYEKELSDKVDHPEFDSQETEIEAEDILTVPMEQLKGKKISTAQGRILRKQHITRNELENLYECELCDFKKAFAVQLSDHVMSAHYDVFIYKCSVESCGKLLRNWSRYSTHKKTHEAEKKKKKKGQSGGEKKKPFRKGTFTIDEEYHLLEQDLYVGKEEGLRIAREYFYFDDSSEKYKCKMCKYVGRHQTVEQHVLAQHLKMLYLFKCDYCEKQIRYSETAFKDHLLLHTVGKLPCPHCQEMDVGAEKRFTKASLAAHLRRIHTAGEFPCGVEGCGLAMATVADLKMHQRQVHFMGLPPQKIRYMCQICGYTFPKKQQLEWHVTSCQAGRSRSRFRQGIADCLTWLGQGVYRCNFCEMDFHPPRETASSLPLARKHVVSVHKMNHLRRAKMSWTQGIQGQTPKKVKKRKHKEIAKEEEGGELEKEMLSPKGKVRVINTYYNVHAQ